MPVKKTVTANDIVSGLLGKIDSKFIDSDDCIGVVQWNLWWFNSKESDRIFKITKMQTCLLKLIDSQPH